VQYELTQHPRLAAQLPGTLPDLLKTALESSRVALNLQQDNADVLLYVRVFRSHFPRVSSHLTFVRDVRTTMLLKSNQSLHPLLRFCQNGLQLLRWVYFMY
jgi:hypothetical protein